jgi:hypothetical protein
MRSPQCVLRAQAHHTHPFTTHSHSPCTHSPHTPIHLAPTHHTLPIRYTPVPHTLPFTTHSHSLYSHSLYSSIHHTLPFTLHPFTTHSRSLYILPFPTLIRSPKGGLRRRPLREAWTHRPTSATGTTMATAWTRTLKGRWLGSARRPRSNTSPRTTPWS